MAELEKFEKENKFEKFDRLEKPNLYEKVISIVGFDIFQVFGESGTCKTTFALELAKSAIKQGKKVVYIDTERNVSETPPGVEYYYAPEINEISDFLRNPPKADVYILDSVGFALVGEIAEKGRKYIQDLIQKVQAWAYILKKMTYRHKALALLINQPKSTFRSGENINVEEIPPVGGKLIFGTKEVWRTSIAKMTAESTIAHVTAWRSRKYGRGRVLFEIKVSDAGTVVKPLV